MYSADNDDIWINGHPEIERIASAIEERRKALGKTSGFERQYHRVAKLYFGGMARHLETMKRVLRPGAMLAYVVGDQASYLRVMIRTGRLLANIATSVGGRSGTPFIFLLSLEVPCSPDHSCICSPSSAAALFLDIDACCDILYAIIKRWMYYSVCCRLHKALPPSQSCRLPSNWPTRVYYRSSLWASNCSARKGAMSNLNCTTGSHRKRKHRRKRISCSPPKTAYIPVEVKSGPGGAIKSLLSYVVKKKADQAVLISSAMPSVEQPVAKVNKAQRPFRLLRIPFYLVNQLERLLAQDA